MDRISHQQPDKKQSWREWLKVTAQLAGIIRAVKAVIDWSSEL